MGVGVGGCDRSKLTARLIVRGGGEGQPDMMQELISKTLLNLLQATMNLVGGLIMVLSPKP